MENKFLLLFFILIEAAILAFCETDSFDSFGPRLNEKTDPGHLDLSKRKDFYLFENNDSAPEVKNVVKRPVPFNDRFSQQSDTVNSFEIRQDTSNTNLSEKQNEMSEFREGGYNNWQPEKNKPFYPTRQDSHHENFAGENGLVNSQFSNNWDKSGNFFQNSQSQWNEEKNFGQSGFNARNEETHYGRIFPVSNMKKPNMYTDFRHANAYGKSPLNREMNGYFRPKNEFPEKTVPFSLLNDDEIKSTNNYDQGLVKNGFQSSLSSRINYYNRNGNSYRNLDFHNPEKGVVINFNTECPTTNPVSNAIFHKFIFAPKARNPQPEIPTLEIPETTLITRQMSTPIYYL